jgi:glycosyltransferase involved in cell wall biosynthesis
MNNVKVTVLMPAYNTEDYIAEAITSILAQTFTDFEFIIVNDGSTDNTEKIIRSFKDPRIVLIQQPNGGVSNALNTGLKNARGKYIARFDADDICLKDRLEVQYQFMVSNPDYVLVGSDADYIDVHGDFIFSPKHKAYENEEIKQLPPSICPFSHVTVMYTKEAVVQAGGYSEDAHTFEDHLLWSKMLPLGKVCNLRETFVKVRFNPASITIDEKWRGERFREIKYHAIEKGTISHSEGIELLQIIRQQNVKKIKSGSYHALLAKKFLWDNYIPQKARKNALALIKLSPLSVEGYGLYMLSLLPQKLIKKIYNSLSK